MQISHFRTSRSLLGCAAALLLMQIVGGVAVGQMLVDRLTLHQNGLERSWQSVASVDSHRSQVVGVTLDADNLFVVSSGAMVQSFDALSGRSLWAQQIGNPDYPSSTLAANKKYLAVTNGSMLYILDRATGRSPVQHLLTNAPGQGLAMTSKFAYVPLVTGRMEGYELPSDREYSSEIAYSVPKTWAYQSSGIAFTAPTVTEDSVYWVTDAGHLYVGHSNKPGVRFRWEAIAELAVAPAQANSIIYLATVNGSVHAVSERSGRNLWQYSSGGSVNESPVVIEDRLYVTSEEPALHCLDIQSGMSVWVARGVTKFAAASATSVYGLDQSGGLLRIDRQTGATISRIPVGYTTDVVANDKNDRVYLVSQSGVLQCLHELGVTLAMAHGPAGIRGKANAGDMNEPEGNEPNPNEPPVEDNPFADDPVAEPANDNPFTDEPAQPEPAQPEPTQPKPAQPAPATPKPEDPGDNPFGIFEDF